MPSPSPAASHGSRAPRRFGRSTCALAAALLAAQPLAARAEAPAPAATDASIPVGRLADAAIPSAYRLDLKVDPTRPRFSGHVEIDATLTAPTRSLYIHGRDLKLHRVVARGADRAIVGTWDEVDPSGVARLSFAEMLPAGPVTFAFDYDAAFQDGPEGMFRVHVGDHWYSWTQFESTDARAAYPSFDQPVYKQPFTVTLRTPKGLTAVSNAPEVGIEHQNGWDVHHFAPTAPLPTYLVAMMVGPFAVASGSVPATPERATPLPLRIVSTQENAGNLAFALANSGVIVRHLEEYFGQSFPYPKLDLITTPILPGAMENAGADLFADPLLVLDDHASPAQKREFGMVVAHELSHQWFGDLVTPKWWSDIWLNESFANWMGYRIGNAWRPDLHISDGALAEGFAAMNLDALLVGRPIQQPITRTAEIDAAFDSITYGKGGQVVAMIAAFMGDDKFREGVRHYMAAHRYGNATSEDFFAAMAEVAGDPRILPAMQSFTTQQGVPLLTFTPAPGGYSVTQSRYARLGTQAPDTRWGVPICARVDGTRSCQLLDDKTATLTLGSGLFMPNAGGTGYYRFELPKEEWDRLIAASATLSGGEALALADSLGASFAAGRASPAQLIALAQTMSANPDSHAGGAALVPLAGLANAGFLDAKATTAYRGFVRGLLNPMLARYGFDPATGAYAGDDPDHAQRRASIVRALDEEGRDPAIRARLRGAARLWLAGNKAALDPVWYDEAFSAWLAAGGMGEARRLFARALASQDPLFRPAALGALASTGRLPIATWLLNGEHDPRLRLSERIDIVSGITETRETRDFGHRWIVHHIDSLLQGGAGIFLSARAVSALGSYCSTERADVIAREFGPKLAGRTSELDFKRVVEQVRDCGRLKAARGGEVSAAVAGL